MDRIKNIEKMEKIMDDHEEILKKLNHLLDIYENHQEKYLEFIKYYSSEQWHIDYDSSNKGEFPKELKCGILSEDAAYNLIGDNFQMGVRLVELANLTFKNHLS